MTLIVTLSNNGGIMFNQRRQSEDKALRERILNIVGEHKLFVSEYTATQFENTYPLIVDNDCLKVAGDEDYVFMEDLDIVPYKNKIKKMIVYAWNENYPSDKYFPIVLDKWDIEKREDFVGDSHEKITEYVFVREENG